jgi:hypothetical protein
MINSLKFRWLKEPLVARKYLLEKSEMLYVVSGEGGYRYPPGVDWDIFSEEQESMGIADVF